MSMKKEFMKYVIPGMISFLFSGIYISVDGLFVGQSVGDAGLASINIVWPLAAIILAIGTGIGMGGAVNLSNYMGANDKENADKSFGNTITLLLIASIVITVFILLFSKTILIILGAEGHVLELAYDYIWILGVGSVLQVVGNGIMPLLRNQNKAWIATILMSANFILNSILSGVFVLVLDYGVAGAAIGTLVGQSVVLIPSLFILFKKEDRVSAVNYILDKKIVRNIIKVSASPIVLTYLPSVTIALVNWQALAYGGTTAVAAYAVVSYVLYVGQLLLQGIGDGSQPLISFYYGADEKKFVGELEKYTYFTSVITGLVIMFGIIALRNAIPIVFGVSEETTALLRDVLPLCAILLPFYAFSRSVTVYFYAIRESRRASLMVYGEALVILPSCIFILPALLGLMGVWISLTVVQVILALGAMAILKWHRNQTGFLSHAMENL